MAKSFTELLNPSLCDDPTVESLCTDNRIINRAELNHSLCQQQKEVLTQHDADPQTTRTVFDFLDPQINESGQSQSQHHRPQSAGPAVHLSPRVSSIANISNMQSIPEAAAESNGTPWYKSWIFIGFIVILLFGLAAAALFFIAPIVTRRRMQFDDDTSFYHGLFESSSTTFPFIQAIFSVFIIVIAVSIQSIFMYLR